MRVWAWVRAPAGCHVACTVGCVRRGNKARDILEACTSTAASLAVVGDDCSRCAPGFLPTTPTGCARETPARLAKVQCSSTASEGSPSASPSASSVPQPSVSASASPSAAAGGGGGGGGNGSVGGPMPKDYGVANLTLLWEATRDGAVCLDGSPPGYYYRPGSCVGAARPVPPRPPHPPPHTPCHRWKPCTGTRETALCRTPPFMHATLLTAVRAHAAPSLLRAHCACHNLCCGCSSACRLGHRCYQVACVPPGANVPLHEDRHPCHCASPPPPHTHTHT